MAVVTRAHTLVRSQQKNHSAGCLVFVCLVFVCLVFGLLLRHRHIPVAAPDTAVTIAAQVPQLVNTWYIVYWTVRSTGITRYSSWLWTWPSDIFVTISAVKNRPGDVSGCFGWTYQVYSSAVCSPNDLSMASLGVTDASPE